MNQTYEQIRQNHREGAQARQRIDAILPNISERNMRVRQNRFDITNKFDSDPEVDDDYKPTYSRRGSFTSFTQRQRTASRESAHENHYVHPDPELNLDCNYNKSSAKDDVNFEATFRVPDEDDSDEENEESNDEEWTD